MLPGIAGKVSALAGDEMGSLSIGGQGGALADEVLEGAGESGQGFETFKDLKDTVGSPGENNHWHHIVEQSQINKSGFSPTQIQNTDNIFLYLLIELTLNYILYGLIFYALVGILDYWLDFRKINRNSKPSHLNNIDTMI